MKSSLGFGIVRAFFGALVTAVCAISIAAQAPPAIRPDMSAVFRADQVHEMKRLKGAGGRETAGLVQRSQTNRAPATLHKDTGLKTTQVPDAKSRRMAKAQADQVLVRLRAGIGKDESSRMFARQQAAAIARTAPLLEKIGYKRVRVPTHLTTTGFLAELAKDAAVQRAEANVLLRSHTEKPGAPSFDHNWGLRAVRAIEAWQVTEGDPSIVVAVVDSGISPQHPDLAGALIPGHNFITDTPDALDEFGHGTQVAGIIAGRHNEQSGTTGVAPRSRLLPLKVLDANGEGTAADVAEAIIYAADSEARVIILALGTYAESGALQAAIEYASGHRCLVIAAGGNNGTAEFLCRFGKAA